MPCGRLVLKHQLNSVCELNASGVLLKQCVNRLLTEAHHLQFADLVRAEGFADQPKGAVGLRVVNFKRLLLVLSEAEKVSFVGKGLLQEGLLLHKPCSVQHHTRPDLHLLGKVRQKDTRSLLVNLLAERPGQQVVVGVDGC